MDGGGVGAQSCPGLCSPMDWSPAGSSVYGIFQAEYWSRLPFPAPGDLPNPGIKPTSAELAGGFFTTSTIWEAHTHMHSFLYSFPFVVYHRILNIVPCTVH